MLCPGKVANAFSGFVSAPGPSDRRPAVPLGWAPPGCRFSPHIDDGVVACDPGTDSCPPGLMCVQRSPTLAVCCREPGCPGINVAINRDGGAGRRRPPPTPAPRPTATTRTFAARRRPTDRRRHRPASRRARAGRRRHRPTRRSSARFGADVLLPPDVMPPPALRAPNVQWRHERSMLPAGLRARAGRGLPRLRQRPGRGRARGDLRSPGQLPHQLPGAVVHPARAGGQPATCNARCMNERISACAAGDNCCPESCNATNDPECGAVCDNGTLEPGETCEPRTECARRDGACNSDTDTMRTRTGDVARCTFVCSEMPRPCLTGDGFCPGRCTPSTDSDCTGCGNGRVEGAETCDPPIACLEQQSRCVSDASTVRTGVGESRRLQLPLPGGPARLHVRRRLLPGRLQRQRRHRLRRLRQRPARAGRDLRPAVRRAWPSRRRAWATPATVRTGSGNPAACTFRLPVDPPDVHDRRRLLPGGLHPGERPRLQGDQRRGLQRQRRVPVRASARTGAAAR